MRFSFEFQDQNFLWNGKKWKWYKLSVNYWLNMTNSVIQAQNVKSLWRFLGAKSLKNAGSLALDTTPVNTKFVACRTYVAWKLGSHDQVSTEADQHPPTLADQQSVATQRHYATPWRHAMTSYNATVSWPFAMKWRHFKVGRNSAVYCILL